jgi:hypothetical protein
VRRSRQKTESSCCVTWQRTPRYALPAGTQRIDGLAAYQSMNESNSPGLVPLGVSPPGWECTAPASRRSPSRTRAALACIEARSLPYRKPRGRVLLCSGCTCSLDCRICLVLSSFLYLCTYGGVNCYAYEECSSRGSSELLTKIRV